MALPIEMASERRVAAPLKEARRLGAASLYLRKGTDFRFPVFHRPARLSIDRPILVCYYGFKTWVSLARMLLPAGPAHPLFDKMTANSFRGTFLQTPSLPIPLSPISYKAG